MCLTPFFECLIYRFNCNFNICFLGCFSLTLCYFSKHFSLEHFFFCFGFGIGLFAGDIIFQTFY